MIQTLKQVVKELRNRGSVSNSWACDEQLRPTNRSFHSGKSVAYQDALNLIMDYLLNAKETLDSIERDLLENEPEYEIDCRKISSEERWKEREKEEEEIKQKLRELNDKNDVEYEIGSMVSNADKDV